MEDIEQQLWEERLSAVYNERDRLVAFLSSCHPSYITKHKEGEPGFQFLIVIETPQGQMTWHIKDKEIKLFPHLEFKEDYEWDGHTTREKYKRLKKLIGEK